MTDSVGGAGVAVVIAAKDEEARIGATVAAARSIPGVVLVVVVDDGSTDRTAVVARSAGAKVARHRRNQGKAAAMQTGAATVQTAELAGAGGGVPGGSAGQSRLLLLFLDADLEESATSAAPLVGPVSAGDADMTIALLPEQATAGGGHGLVVSLARNGIRQATGWEATQPLSGQRCLTPRRSPRPVHSRVGSASRPASRSTCSGRTSACSRSRATCTTGSPARTFARRCTVVGSTGMSPSHWPGAESYRNGSTGCPRTSPADRRTGALGSDAVEPATGRFVARS